MQGGVALGRRVAVFEGLGDFLGVHHPDAVGEADGGTGEGLGGGLRVGGLDVAAEGVGDVGVFGPGGGVGEAFVVEGEAGWGKVSRWQVVCW